LQVSIASIAHFLRISSVGFVHFLTLCVCGFIDPGVTMEMLNDQSPG